MKYQLNGEFNLPKTSIVNCSVVLVTQQENTSNYSTLTPIPESLGNIAPTSCPAEGTPLLDTAPPALILHLDLRSTTSPSPVAPNPDPLVPDQSTPAPLTTPYPVLDSITFSPGIEQALLYAAMMQANPPAATSRDDMADTAKATAR